MCVKMDILLLYFLDIIIYYLYIYIYNYQKYIIIKIIH